MSTREDSAGADATDTVVSDTRLSPTTIVLILVIVLMPFPLVLHTFTSGKFTYDFEVVLFPSDLPLAALTILMIPRAVARVREGTLGIIAWLLLGLVAWLVVAFAFHPSGRGVADLLRLAGVLAIVLAIVDLRTREERALVVGSVAVATIFQLVLGVVQLARKGPVGLNSVGEFKEPLWRIGGALAPQGTMVHPYVLAGLALVAGVVVAAAITRGRPRTWLVPVAAALSIAPVGFTFSRAALLGFAIAVLCLATGLLVDRRWYLTAVIALCVGAAVPALIWNDGWVGRTHQSISSTKASSLTTDRGWLIHEADGLIVDHLAVGVGPGRYIIALRDKFHTEPNRTVGVFKPVHNLPLLLTAEGGVPAGLLMTALLLAAAWRGYRGGREGLALFAALLPFTLLDHFGYTFPQGLIITGIWLGGIELLAGTRNENDAETPAAPAP